MQEVDLLLFRDMDVESDGLPLVEASNVGLGVRTDGDPKDIEVENGRVKPSRPKRRGMSVSPDSPQKLGPRHRHKSLEGGYSDYPTWQIAAHTLPDVLHYEPTSDTHGVIEPAHEMDFKDYVDALEGTREHWTRVVG
jgi:hypothetical protein